MPVWIANSKSAQPTEVAFFDIGGGFNLSLGGNVSLLVQPKTFGSVWAGDGKSSNSWSAVPKS